MLRDMQHASATHEPLTRVGRSSLCTAACGGTKPQWLRKGGVKGGTVLDDNATLEQCGFTQDMGVWEVRPVCANCVRLRGR
jgi:hypothetical protein